MKADSKELVDAYSEFAIFMGLGRDYYSVYGEGQMYFLIRQSNILQELLRRNDFAEPLYNKYMSIEYPGYMEQDDSEELFERASVVSALFTMQYILSQSEACIQLEQEQREKLVKHLVNEAQLIRDRKIMPYFWSYDSNTVSDCNFFNNISEGNAWYYAINDMALTADEWEVIDYFVEWNEKQD